MRIFVNFRTRCFGQMTLDRWICTSFVSVAVLASASLVAGLVMQPSGSVPLLEAEANETFGPGNPGRGPFIRLPARKRPGMSQAALAKSRRSAIYGILVVAALTAGASGTFAADGCPTSASEISTDRPDVTNSSLVVPYGSLQAENGVDWSVRQGSNVVSGSETRLRLGVAQCPEEVVGRRAYVLLLPQRPGVVEIFRLRCLHQEGNCPFPSAFAYLQPAVWDFRPAAAKFRAAATILTFSSPWSRRISDEWSLQGMFTVMVHEPNTAIRPSNRRCRLNGT